MEFPAAMAPKPIRRVAANGLFEEFHIFLGDGILVPFGGIVRNHLHIHTIVAHTLLDHLIVEYGDIVLAGEMLRSEDHACGLVQKLCDITTFPAVVLFLSSQMYQHLLVSVVLLILSCTLVGTVMTFFLGLAKPGITASEITSENIKNFL